MNRGTCARVRFFPLLFLAAFSPSASADPVATVVQFRGQVLVVQGDQKAKAETNMKLEKGAVIQTMPGSTIKLQMADKSVVDVGAGTFLKLDGASGEKREVDLSLEEGKIRAFVKKRAPSEKGRFTIRTKSATMGVRGTQFLASSIKIGPSEFKSSFYCFNGAVFVDDLRGQRLADLKPNQFIAVSAKETKPGELRNDSGAKAAAIPAGISEKISSDGFLASPDSAERVIEIKEKTTSLLDGSSGARLDGSGPAIDPQKMAPRIAPSPIYTPPTNPNGTEGGTLSNP